MPEASAALPRQRTHSFRPDIQGLRAVAVGAVVLDHLFGWPNGGFIGVDVFFVISGFLITGLLLKEYERRGTISFWTFYQRRVKRIIPAATLVLAATIGASFLLLSPSRFRETAWDALASFGFVANWRFAATGTDYFQEGLPPSPLQHYWSLSVEEQFYFVWPWAMLALLIISTAVLRVPRRHARTIAGAAIAAISITSFWWALQQSANEATIAYFSTLTRAWELGLGALIATVSTRLAIRNLAVRTALAYIGLGGIGASMFLVTPEVGFPAPWALLPVLSTGLVIFAGVGGDQPYLWPLTNRVSGYVGEISYSLYLWHWPVIILLLAVIPGGTVAFYAWALVLMVGLSVASFHLVEDPLRRAQWIVGRSRSRRRRGRLAPGWGTVGLVAIGALTVVMVVALFTKDRSLPDLPPTANPATGVDGSPASEPPCFGAAVLADGCEPTADPSAVFPAPANMSEDTGRAYECWIEEGAAVSSCTYGSGPTRVALVGDSHAAMLIPALRPQVDDLGWTLSTFVGFNCQFRDPSQSCDAMGEIVDTLAGGEYDVVLTAAYRVTASGLPSAELERVWSSLPESTTVVVIEDSPAVSEEALQCVMRVNFDPASDSCSTPRSEALSSEDSLVEAARAAGRPVVSMLDLFCVESECPAVIGNALVYRDAAGHTTGTFAETTAPFLSRRITRALTAP